MRWSPAWERLLGRAVICARAAAQNTTVRRNGIIRLIITFLRTSLYDAPAKCNWDERETPRIQWRTLTLNRDLVPPRAQHPVSRNGGRGLLAAFQQLALDQPRDPGLSGALGDSNGIGQRLVADLYPLSAAAAEFKREVKVNQEAGWLAIVTDQVAHQDVAYVIINLHAVPASTIAGST